MAFRNTAARDVHCVMATGGAAWMRARVGQRALRGSPGCRSGTEKADVLAEKAMQQALQSKPPLEMANFSVSVAAAKPRSTS
jgi:hypothetical protein